MASARTVRLLGGLSAAAVALGAATLFAAPFGTVADPRLAVGATVVDLAPGPAVEWAIRTFGVADKLALGVLVVVVVGMLAAFTAEHETPRRPVGSATLAALGMLGALAVAARSDGDLVAVVPTVLGTVCGVAVLRWIVRRTGTPGGHAPPAHAGGGAAERAGSPVAGRRAVLVSGAAGVAAAAVGTWLSRRWHSVGAERATVPPPRAAVPAPPVTSAVTPPGAGLPSFVTPNDDFYRIDTALVVPQVSREQWRLRVHGMVDRELDLGFGDLAAFELVDRMVTLTCVSNPVGGELVGNALWTGWRVRDLLARAGVSPEADMVLSTSADGFTAGTPVAALVDDRDALLAVAMNGAPLPTEHGYPARLVVPGLYGYVSATKWVVDLELTRFDRAEAYWTSLGWSPRGPIKTQSRIAVPRDGGRVAAGPVTIGGVAWAQGRGVRRVELRIDDGDWRDAELGAAYSDDTWRLWSLTTEIAAGRHTAEVRATDDTGATQTATWAPPVPDGATGWHSVLFTAA